MVMLLFVAGCTLFDTRDPEPPDGGSGPPFMQPDRPEIVLENLANAIAALNLQNYLRSFEDAFTYLPTQAAQQANPDLWENWGKDEEETYFNTLISASQSGSNHNLTFADINTEIISSSEQQITARYNLTVQHNRNTDGIPTMANGQMILRLVSGNDGLWAIQEWTDISGSSSFTWSDLRAAFVRG